MASTYGSFGGRYVAETLMPALEELERAFEEATADPAFEARRKQLLADYVGRPTPLYRAENLSRAVGFSVWLKREDLCHTGAHKMNNVLGQVLLAKRMGKPRVIAETGAGQHGVATATGAALLGLSCEVFMGEEDVRRQAPNVRRMQLLGAKVHPVQLGQPHAQGRDERGDARLGHERREHVLLRRHRRRAASVSGDRARVPARDRRRGARADPEGHRQAADAVVACVGGGSNAIGVFAEFIERRERAPDRRRGGRARAIETGRHAATLSAGTRGVLHGMRSYVLQDERRPDHRDALDQRRPRLPGVGPEHALLKDSGRAEYHAVTDDEALAALQQLCRQRGHHPRAREQPRDRVPAAAVAASDPGRTARWSCACRAAATRTCRPCSRSSTPRRPRRAQP